MTLAPRIAICIPCYNEQEALPHSIPVLLDLLDTMTADGLISPDSYIICCDDGSKDQTWQTLKDLHSRDPRVKAIALAHNRGHQHALLAALMTAHNNCDAAISIDADLQDDPKAIIQMVKNYRGGDHIVYGVRSSRQTDTWFKRTTAHAFYRLQRAMGVDTIYDHADYRLMSNKALDMLSQYRETNLYLRGIIPNIGLSHSTVTYPRSARIAGESKYPLRKMLALSIDGITSFSAKPMRLIFLTGVFLLLADIIVAVWVLIAHLNHVTISGWSSLMLSVWFLGSLILIALGTIGEYIGKIYIEVKQRPPYAISDKIWD